MVKNLPMQEMWVRSLGQKDPPEKPMATHSNPIDRGALGGYSPWGCKELDTTERACTHIRAMEVTKGKATEW